jgi:adenylate kinase
MEARPDRNAWIKGGEARCDPPAQAQTRPWRLVLLGAPGVGKGTQAELIATRLGACQLSTGDVFRAAKALAPCDRSPALNAALESMRRGELVPDETVLAMVRERVDCLRCRGGFLLDGFPRTVRQAEALDEILRYEKLALDGVLSYEMPIERVVARLSGRRTCGSCKAVYHVEARRPAKEGVCDHCGGALFQREDDRPEAVRVRMATYEKSTAPLIRYYAERGLLRPVPAEGVPEEVHARTLDALQVTC